MPTNPSSRDSADFITGLIGSSPNYFFDVREEDLPDFLDLLPISRRARETMQDRPDTASTGRKTGSGTLMIGFKRDSMRMNP